MEKELCVFSQTIEDNRDRLELDRNRKRVEAMNSESIIAEHRYNGDIEKGTFKTVEQLHMGEMNVKCEHCNAERFKYETGRVANNCCHGGKITLPPLTEYPDVLQCLREGNDEVSRHFRQHIRSYNDAFAFASFNCTVADMGNSGPYVMKIIGDVSYKISTSLETANNNRPRYGQIYIYDVQTQLALRENDARRANLLEIIGRLIIDINPHAANFRTTYERFVKGESLVRLNFIALKEDDRRRMRHMQQQYQDAMAITRKVGRPDLFITMTCNPKWPEICTVLKDFPTGTTVNDIPTIACRIFNMRLQQALKEIESGSVFGKIEGYVYTVEFQKRGLPHAHILFILNNNDKLLTPEAIDSFISAEIPDKRIHQQLYQSVTSHMLHGPHTSKIPCWNSVTKSCSKKFPKDLVENTDISGGGFPKYRRRKNTDINYYRNRVEGRNIQVNNSMVVPHNPYLLAKYDCHMNVEYCASIMAIKYVFKYIHKGHDRARVQITDSNSESDGPMEAAWRILELPMHGRSHAVTRLPVHLPGQQYATFEEGREVEAATNEKKWRTHLIAWFELNSIDEMARNITYANTPDYYSFQETTKTWKKRKYASGNRALCAIEHLLRAEARSCADFYLPIPEIIFENEAEEITVENIETFSKKGNELVKQLNNDQKIIYTQIFDNIMDNKSTDRKQEKCFYIDGSGGTGKTFLYNALYYMLKSEKKNVACVAWTGIAAILLPYGTTAHKIFGLPLTLQKEGTIFTNATMKKKIRSIDVIIWDECSMIPKIAIELIDRTLKDIMEDASPFGGKTIILGGDFRQVLPVVKRGGKQQIIEETIKYSTLWSIFEKLSLKKNMRAKEDAAKFSEWLLNIGNGEVELFVPEKEIQSNNLIDDLYPRNLPLDELTNRAILAPLNVEVNQLNTEILRRMDGNIFESKSIDYATLQGIDTADAALDEEATLRYPIEYLNGLTPSGLPPHNLQLKVEAIVMSLRNLSISDGLCNGTRLVVREMHSRILIGELLIGERKGQIVEIPRIKLDTRGDTDMPFILHRRQFPVRLAFAITINKSQGQSFDHVGIFIDRPIFGHGQIYVALSRCRSKKGMKIQLKKNENAIKNIAYKEIIE
ncbi:uncharacterized protein LOC124178246 [Neodiprion fabricii]|uniref:uncharacterized protein LOC124178246 n=1 Tax=Neodiprion fabricii TaxID=2872261 RepID=UPI001ED9009D|nr:uncharacterized protein LOC124178246 [Neodiprion fabricii]